MPHVNPGNYRATALRHELRESKAGNPYSAVEFRLLDTPVNITWRGMYTDKQKERTIESLRHCGWTGDDLASVTFPEDNEVVLVIEDELYEEKVHSRVRFVNSSHRTAVKNALPPANAKAFAARMKGAIVAFDQKKKTDPAAPVVTPAQTVGDDIPF